MLPRGVVLVFVLALLSSAPGALAMPVVFAPRAGDADVPSATSPVAVVTAFDADVWSFTEGVRSRDVVVPGVAWNRVVLRLFAEAETDPWDRLFGVAIAGTEVLHGTTPRADMTIERDVTAYAALLPAGGTVPVRLYAGTWVGYMRYTVELLFYDDATVALVEPAHDLVVSPLLFRGLGGPGSVASANATFPAAAVARGVVELTTSGHGANGEFWYLNAPHTPPTFVIRVDGEEIGRVTAAPYVYALLGFSPQSTVMEVVHTAMWWTAQRALDAVGVHTGAGEIPAYRAQLPDDVLAKLVGERDVSIMVEGGGGGYWPTSLTFLLDA